MRIIAAPLLIAASLLITGCNATPAYLGAALKPPGTAQPVATITDTKDALWLQFQRPADRFAPPQIRYLQLKSGSATVLFNSGVSVTLTGPAEFGILSHSRSDLRQGSLVASVPDEAHGFTVGLPGAAVTGLGGEFHAAIEADGGARVKVIEGFAQFVPGQSKPQILPAGQGATFAPTKPPSDPGATENEGSNRR